MDKSAKYICLACVLGLLTLAGASNSAFAYTEKTQHDRRVRLAKWIAENQPAIPVTVTSGDSEKIVTAPDFGGGFQFVSKPYELDALADQIRRTLDQRNSA